MAVSEKELERIIESDLSKELDANIEVPDINNQWQKIRKQLLEENDIAAITNQFLKQRKIVVAATILISVGSLNFLYPNNANAVGGKIAEFFNYMVGKTTQNRTETYKQANAPSMPKVQDLGSTTEREVTLDQAQASIPFKLATPNYLPPETTTRRVLLTSLGANVSEVSIEYIFNDKVIVFSQQNNANGTSRGSLYDTEDTVVKDLVVNDSPGMVFMSKNGIKTLNWQLRGLVLQITGSMTEEDIIKIANSIN